MSCGCFSVSPDVGGETALNLVRNSLLLAAGLWLLIYTAGKPEPERPETSDGVIHNAG